MSNLLVRQPSTMMERRQRASPMEKKSLKDSLIMSATGWVRCHWQDSVLIGLQKLVVHTSHPQGEYISLRHTDDLCQWGKL